jgi:transcriptional regulator
VYMPPHFRSNDPDIAAELMRDHAFATLISTDDDGNPFVTHLPLHAERAGDGFTIWGHCAKPNPHWRYLQARPKALAVFSGPHAYMSPQVYPDLARVPTWNYLAVHCQVEARLIEDDAGKDSLLKKLIGDHEPAYAKQWIDLGEDFQRKMLAGIVGFELRVTAWECKLKLNQHRKEAHGAMRSAYAAGTPDERALAQWMDRLGLGTTGAT